MKETMRVTRKAVNKALENAGFDGVTIERGDGYWYFWGGESTGWYSASVAVYRLGSFTVEEWVNEAKALRDDWHNK